MVHVIDVGVMAYRAAWDRQLALHDEVLSGKPPAGAMMLVEHPPVITIGRRPEAGRHLLASPAALAARGVDLVETDRGGDITFHGPGQLVAYPIIPLNLYHFNLHSYMRFLEDVVIATLAVFGVEAMRDPSPKPATGVWVRQRAEVKGLRTEEIGRRTQSDDLSVLSPQSSALAKICALGIKVRRWVTLHGMALNVTTDLSFFELINPCGLSRPVTSMERVLGRKVPEMGAVKGALTRILQKTLYSSTP
jgi:lipoyl(octanoyl) transferase